ncbi:hypothetical protein F4810DRAFT_720032 [Camillea tinctor]|nr:hypothetical protein F4810DRAFT_720032 [Camillea tinctor]
MSSPDNMALENMSPGEWLDYHERMKRKGRKALRTEWRTDCSEKAKSESLHQALYSGGSGKKKYSWLNTTPKTPAESLGVERALEIKMRDGAIAKELKVGKYSEMGSMQSTFTQEDADMFRRHGFNVDLNEMQRLLGIDNPSEPGLASSPSTPAPAEKKEKKKRAPRRKKNAAPPTPASSALSPALSSPATPFPAAASNNNNNGLMTPPATVKPPASNGGSEEGLQSPAPKKAATKPKRAAKPKRARKTSKRARDEVQVIDFDNLSDNSEDFNTQPARKKRKTATKDKAEDTTAKPEEEMDDMEFYLTHGRWPGEASWAPDAEAYKMAAENKMEIDVDEPENWPVRDSPREDSEEPEAETDGEADDEMDVDDMEHYLEFGEFRDEKKDGDEPEAKAEGEAEPEMDIDDMEHFLEFGEFKDEEKGGDEPEAKAEGETDPEMDIDDMEHFLEFGEFKDEVKGGEEPEAEANAEVDGEAKLELAVEGPSNDVNFGGLFGDDNQGGQEPEAEANAEADGEATIRQSIEVPDDADFDSLFGGDDEDGKRSQLEAIAEANCEVNPEVAAKNSSDDKDFGSLFGSDDEGGDEPEAEANADADGEATKVAQDLDEEVQKELEAELENYLEFGSGDEAESVISEEDPDDEVTNQIDSNFGNVVLEDDESEISEEE